MYCAIDYRQFCVSELQILIPLTPTGIEFPLQLSPLASYIKTITETFDFHATLLNICFQNTTQYLSAQLDNPYTCVNTANGSVKTCIKGINRTAAVYCTI